MSHLVCDAVAKARPRRSADGAPVPSPSPAVRRHEDPEKTVRRLAYSNRVLRRRIAELERERDEARRTAGQSPDGDCHVRRFDYSSPRR